MRCHTNGLVDRDDVIIGIDHVHSFDQLFFRNQRCCRLRQSNFHPLPGA
jgi:hypothetical protein